MTYPAAIEGAERAARHANAVTPKWTETAMEFLKLFGKSAGGRTFLAEEVRVMADRGAHVPPPPDGRAWGAVFQRAKREGILLNAGYSPANSSNGSPKCLWRFNAAR